MSEKTLAVYDPAMCCSSGVCGPDVDPTLTTFAADLAWLTAQGVSVTRYNLAQQPGEFVAQAAVKEALERDGDGALPMLLVGGRAVMSGAYPTREQLARWLGVTTEKPAGAPAGAPKPCCSPKSGCC